MEGSRDICCKARIRRGKLGSTASGGSGHLYDQCSQPIQTLILNIMRRDERYRSPRRDVISSELEEHSNKIKELLRQDLNMLEDENAILRSKCKKVGELEDKVEMVLKQNSELLAENEKISKLLHQKKSELEILRNKYDTAMAHRMGNSAEHEFEKKKMINEIEHLRSELHEVQHSRTLLVSDLKGQHQVELQALRRQNATAQDVYEQEIRKLREQLEKRDYDNSQNLNRLKRISSESEYEILRLKEEKEKLRNELGYLEAERKKDLDSLKAKLEVNYIEEIETIKRTNLSAIDNLETENFRLKEYLDSKSREVEDLTAKNIKQKTHFEETIVILRNENESLRYKMLEGERYSESEIDKLKLKLHEMHEAEIAELKLNNQKYMDCLQAEVLKLEGVLANKNDEIEQLIKQKSSVRQMFASEGGRLKEEIESLLHRNKDIELKLRETEEKYEARLKDKEDHITYLDELNSDQKEANEKEQQALKQIIEFQKSELEQERISNREKEQALKESLSEFKNEAENVKDMLRREKADKERKVNDLTLELESSQAQLNTKIETLKTQTNILERQNESVKKTVELKEKQVRSFHERVRSSDDRERKLEKEIEDLRIKLIKKDQKNNEMLAEQKSRLENSFNYTLQNLKSDHEGALKLEQNKISDANERLRKKDKELEDLLRAYKKMREELEVLTEQEANKKEMTLKYPGATADLIATKNLFDVYLKSKVLDVCGDAIGKQNDGR